MKINGFQKMTMLDYPEKVACTIFTPGCNFRCPFCHNARLVTHIEAEDAYDEREVLSYLEKRKNLLDGVCITGGEPLLQPELADFIRRVRQTGLLVKLDTNGYLPDKLRALIDAGLLDYVAMDVKNTPEKYGMTVGIEAFDVAPIEESIALLKMGKIPYEFRTTAVRELHTKDDLVKTGKWLAGATHYYIQSFTDSGDLIGNGLHAPDRAVLEAAAAEIKPFVPSVALRGV